MAQFIYRARTPEGERREGLVEARSLEAAVEVLQRQSLIVTDIRPPDRLGLLIHPLKLFQRVPARDIVIFSRQLSTLFQAKVPVIQALKTLLQEATNQTMRSSLGAILDDVTGGSALSQAFSRHPHIFSSFYVNMVRAGEESGKLEEVFTYLADYLERSYILISKARNALIYPAFVSLAFVGVIIVMLVVVIPRLTAIFSELKADVPFYTRAIMALSSFLQAWGVVLLVVLAILAVLGWRYTKTRRGRELFDEFKIRIPILGTFFRKLYLTRLTDNLSTLIRAGIPIIRALEITADVVGNRLYQRIILDAAESVKAGNTISSSFERYRDVPPLVTQMIRIGEESGRLDFLLSSATSFYQRDVDSMLENLVSLIEPVLIIMLGLGVGILVAAVLIPLYNLTSLL